MKKFYAFELFNTEEEAGLRGPAIAVYDATEVEEGLANYTQENERLKAMILAARRNGSVPEAFWLTEHSSDNP